MSKENRFTFAVADVQILNPGTKVPSKDPAPSRAAKSVLHHAFDELKHLPGRHDQSTHGRRNGEKPGGGGSAALNVPGGGGPSAAVKPPEKVPPAAAQGKPQSAEKPPAKPAALALGSIVRTSDGALGRLAGNVGPGQFLVQDLAGGSASIHTQSELSVVAGPDQAHLHLAPATGVRASIAQGSAYKQRELQRRERYLSPQGNKKINGGLRDGTLADDDPVISDLDRALGRATTTREITIYRGIALPPDLDLNVGASFLDKAYVSTSEKLQTARDFAALRATGEAPGMAVRVRALGGEPVVMAIRVPVGSNLLAGDDSVQEWILPRGQSFRVTGRRADGVLEVDILER